MYLDETVTDFFLAELPVDIVLKHWQDVVFCYIHDALSASKDVVLYFICDALPLRMLYSTTSMMLSHLLNKNVELLCYLLSHATSKDVIHYIHSAFFQPLSDVVLGYIVHPCMPPSL